MADYTILAEITKVSGTAAIDWNMWMTLATALAAIATALAAIATFVAAYFTFRSVQESQRMADIAERQLGLEASPYIIIEKIELIPANPTATPPTMSSISFSVKNVGKVTAKIQKWITYNKGARPFDAVRSIEPTESHTVFREVPETKEPASACLRIEFWPEGIIEKKKIKEFEISINWSTKDPTYHITRVEYLPQEVT